MKNYNEEDLRLSQEDWDMLADSIFNPEVIPELKKLLESESVFEE